MQRMSPKHQSAVVKFAAAQSKKHSTRKAKIQPRVKRMATPGNSAPKRRIDLTLFQQNVLETMRRMPAQIQIAVVRFAASRPRGKAKNQKQVTRMASSNNSAPKQSGDSAPGRVRPRAASISENRKLTSPATNVPPVAIVGALGSPKEDCCDICHRILAPGTLPDHKKSRCPERPESGAEDGVSHLPFRLLPPGVWDVNHVLEYYRNEARHWLGGRILDNERLRKVERLNPSHRSVGTDAHLGYILYQFSWSGVVVLECPVVGNATYILWDDWRGMLRLTKSELRSKTNCLCIRHTDRSFGRVRAALDRQKVGISPKARLNSKARFSLN